MQCLKMLKHLCRLCDSEDLCHKTLDEHHGHDLDKYPFQSDPALYNIIRNGIPMSLSRRYVDDILRPGSPGFRQLEKKTNGRF